MKTSSKLIFVFAVVLWGLNAAKAQTSLKDDKAMKATEVKDLVNNKDFVFEATRGTRQKGDMASYHKYNVAIAKDSLVANLPGSKKPLKISTTNFAYNAMKDKRGDWDIIIKPKAGLTSDVKQIKMEVTPQGHASLRVTTYNRGPLSFDGYIKQEDY